jgi:uncharacterized protein YcbK (DUF882 family)
MSTTPTPRTAQRARAPRAKVRAAVVVFALLDLALLPVAIARRSGPDVIENALPAPSPRVPSLADLALGGDLVPMLPPRDRLVAMENVNTGEKETFNIGPGGYIRSDQTPALERFLRCRRTGRETRIDPGVLNLLADISERWPGHVIELVSGFRAPPFGVPHSRHFIGHAIDLRVRGVALTAVRDFVWFEHRNVGVGYYIEGNFLHVDSRGGVPEAAWTAAEEDSAYEYNPRWASRFARTANTSRALAN